VRLLFKTTLHQAKAATETALGHTVTINSVVVPQHFKETHSLTLLKEVAVQEGFATFNHQVIWTLNGARLAYNLDSCGGFDLKPGERCKIDYDDNFVMSVNYDRNRLLLAMVYVGLYIFIPFTIRHYGQYGEASGSIVSYFTRPVIRSSTGLDKTDVDHS
jgi:hypothetical protein